MRKEKNLIGMLQGLVHLLSEEAARNSEFALQLESLLEDLPEKRATTKKTSTTVPLNSLPDIHAEWASRGEGEFRLWLREQPIPVLRAIVRAQDLDAARRTIKWKDAEKFAEFIADSLRARLARGSAFIGKPPLDENHEDN